MQAILVQTTYLYSLRDTKIFWGSKKKYYSFHIIFKTNNVGVWISNVKKQ